MVFGITAFGASLFSVPLLSWFLPLELVLPVTTLLDTAAALLLGRRLAPAADRTELRLLLPACLVGAVLGVTLLVNLPRNGVVGALGLFLIAHAALSLRGRGARPSISRRWAPFAGLVGGALGALFGVGGPPYAVYLSRRTRDAAVFRATLANMIFFSVSIRSLVFLASGLMRADRLLAFALLVPFTVLGLHVGSRLQRRVSGPATLRLVSLLLLLIGAVLLRRAIEG